MEYKKVVDTILIILPTYNEAENIREVLDRIYENKIQNAEIFVLVVDDSSPDGTANLARTHYNKNTLVFQKKEKNGLGAAYIAGMKYGLKNTDANIFFEMDADLSHNPKDIPRMVKKLSEGYDVVIGSRYVEGGRLPEDWGAYRKIISKAANIYTKSWLNLGVKDCTGGFRAIRRKVIEQVNLDKLHADGYAFQVAFLAAAKQLGFQITEIPISFEDRTNGESKMGFSDIWEMGITVPRIRLQNEAAET